MGQVALLVDDDGPWSQPQRDVYAVQRWSCPAGEEAAFAAVLADREDIVLLGIRFAPLQSELLVRATW